MAVLSVQLVYTMSSALDFHVFWFGMVGQQTNLCNTKGNKTKTGPLVQDLKSPRRTGLVITTGYNQLVLTWVYRDYN